MLFHKAFLLPRLGENRCGSLALSSPVRRGVLVGERADCLCKNSELAAAATGTGSSLAWIFTTVSLYLVMGPSPDYFNRFVMIFSLLPCSNGSDTLLTLYMYSLPSEVQTALISPLSNSSTEHSSGTNDSDLTNGGREGRREETLYRQYFVTSRSIWQAREHSHNSYGTQMSVASGAPRSDNSTGRGDLVVK